MPEPEIEGVKLLESIGAHIAELAQHAGNHGYEDGVAGITPGTTDAPACLIGHMVELSQMLFAIANPNHYGSVIVLPGDLGTSTMDQLEALARDRGVLKVQP